MLNLVNQNATGWVQGGRNGVAPLTFTLVLRCAVKLTSSHNPGRHRQAASSVRQGDGRLQKSAGGGQLHGESGYLH
jgi:hypothetical protein